MLALLATGRTSGLVVDCGQQETVALPVSACGSPVIILIFHRFLLHDQCFQCSERPH